MSHIVELSVWTWLLIVIMATLIGYLIAVLNGFWIQRRRDRRIDEQAAAFHRALDMGIDGKAKVYGLYRKDGEDDQQLANRLSYAVEEHLQQDATLSARNRVRNFIPIEEDDGDGRQD